MISDILKIRETVKEHPNEKIQNLAKYINVGNLKLIHRMMDSKKAVGIDKVTKEEYEYNLTANLEDVVSRMKREAYKPKPVKKVLIPKTNGKMRPLGISTYEDKIVSALIGQILNEIYEPKFIETSYGFRYNRNCHQAIREVIEDTQYRKTNYIVEADIKGFFDNINHDWLIKFLEHDIADRKLIDIIKRFLKAGVMEEGKYYSTLVGTPQGSGMSPVLANIYLHYVLDIWFELRVKKQSKGEAYLVRYCDDFICCFQYESDAKEFYDELQNRFKKFGLELAMEKTKILEFGRFARHNRKVKGMGKPETFDFLGFTFYCGEDGTKTFYRTKVKSSKAKVRKKLLEIKEWLKMCRHYKITDLIKRINQILIGYYHYYGVTDNLKSIDSFRSRVVYLLYKWVNRRGQRNSYNNEEFFNLLKIYPIRVPKVYISLFYRETKI